MKGPVPRGRDLQRNKRGYDDRDGQELAEDTFPHLSFPGDQVSRMGYVMEAVGAFQLLVIVVQMRVQGGDEPCRQEDCQ